MTTIPLKQRKEMALDPYYRVCARQEALHDHECDGKITWEHALIYAGKKVQSSWSIIPLCEWAHSVNRHQDGPGLNKEINVWIALNRATDEEVIQVSKAIDYIRMRAVLNGKYGVPALVVSAPALGIAN